MTARGRLAGLDVAVVGGGIIGSTLSFRLGQAGARVQLVEASYPGSGTSGNAVAWLNAFGKQPGTTTT